MCKIFERIVYGRLWIFSEEKFFYNEQFGFRSGYSTVYALAELLEDTRFDGISLFTSILFDLRKAFDTNDL